MARVLVTGAAGGLGRSLVAAFEARGDDVLGTDLADAELTLDITSDADWAAARDHVEQTWGGLDILVNNAGIAGGGRLDQDTIEEWQRLVDINLMGAVRGTKAFVSMFKTQRGGHIVNIASLAGLVHPAGMGSYNATKAAVVALTETTGHELAGFGVRASVVCPSYFRTGLVDHMQGSDSSVGRVIGRLVKESPLGSRRHRPRGHRGHRARRRADPSRRRGARGVHVQDDRPAGVRRDHAGAGPQAGGERR